ncbi:unnamed protein product (plasmid) [Mycetohabitans rhizoxinica HKI 454]|uniref:Uncharacterized protein n=1 Tax=Mycetohabitans rhizoxinica (strain DSM 19002 / CIP 109453 / HKI 454) TaxID=882378 RepID=E5AVK0_MYCRK|nr:unnamed protein product [Mycetohabitans rhizoxinica HKI 454]
MTSHRLSRQNDNRRRCAACIVAPLRLHVPRHDNERRITAGMAHRQIELLRQ